MAVQIVFETHSTSVDNEQGVASGWAHSRLAATGQEQARQLGQRRRDDGIAVVFASDLGRAVETATIAFRGTSVPVFLDWRLRECDYGDQTRIPVAELHRDREHRLDEPYPGGESWRQAVHRVGGFLEDLPTRWDNTRVLVIGYVATRWALDHVLCRILLEELVEEEFSWQKGWEYTLA